MGAFVLISICMLLSSLSSACRAVPHLRLEAVQATTPYWSRHARVELASTVSLAAQKVASSLSTADSLLALLGSKQQADSVDPEVSCQILPYLRFLVPPQLPGIAPHLRSTLHDSGSCDRFKPFLYSKKRWHEALIDQLIHSPPSAVADLARTAVEWNGDHSVILNALSPESYLVPNVDGANEQHCQLAKYTHGQRFVKEELNRYFAFLFEAIAALAPAVGLNVTLNRFDLFHGHLFLANRTGRLGVLFHAREYPAYNNETFPVHLGYCQAGSPLLYDDTMNLRNILWLAPLPDCSNRNCPSMGKWLAPGSLLILDAHPEGIIFKDLVPDYVDIVRTIYEDDFGAVIVDVNYFSTPNDRLEDRLFIC